MKLLLKLVLLSFAPLGLFANLPDEFAETPGKSLIKGLADHKGVSALIKTVNDSNILFQQGYKLGNKVWLEPGVHEIKVMCLARYSWGNKLEGISIEIEVKEGYDYHLIGSYIDGTPNLAIQEKKRI